MWNSEDRESGFGLAEMIGVVVIIGILTAIAVGATINQRQKANDLALTNDVKTLQTDVQQYWTGAAKQYPQSVNKQPMTNAMQPVWMSESDAKVEYTVTADRKDYCINASLGKSTYYYKHSLGEKTSPQVCK